ncbi:MAG: cytochrome b/b6 domain-containing protein [Bryobacteraceae bacterium]|nr:cytochrome b/b6 domain-containing protein [Bryobacteraceae bacterium]
MEADQGGPGVVAEKDDFVPRFALFLLILSLVPLAWGQSPPAATVPNSKCAECHDVEAKLHKSAHAAVACTSCHVKHEEYPHPENQPKPACANCHSAEVQNFSQSVHGAEVSKGNAAAPNCDTCHGVAHEVVSTKTAEWKKASPDLCAMCHDKEATEYQASVHGMAVARGVTAAAVCTDCHTSHSIMRPKNPESSVFANKVPETCGRCHADVRLMSRFGIPSDRITTFDASFHGLALKSGSQTVADCASCHGFHNILPSSDPRSRTNPKNLAHTCGACHPGAGTRFAIGSVHSLEGTRAPLPIQWVQWFYMLVIPGTLAFMAIHHAGDFLRKLTQLRFQGRNVPSRVMKPLVFRHRMYLTERIEHGLLTVSFLTLAYTGFALHYPDGWWAHPFLRFEHEYPIRGVIHRTAGVILVATAIFHVITVLFSKRFRTHWMEFLPKVSDVREMVEGVMWRIGLRKERPHYSSHGYIEKIEYWALVWGTAVMAATGCLLWFNNWTLSMMPKVWMDVARTIHYYEAVLATAAIVIWHMYTVIFDPDVYPMDPGWWTGYSPRPASGEAHGSSRASAGASD